LTTGHSLSAGGLVTALGPVVMKCGGLWIGWPGSHDVRPLDEIPEPDIPNSGLKSQQVKAVLVRQELFDSFYNGCCNGTFWPLFHSMPDRAIFSSDTWKVNIKSSVSPQDQYTKLCIFRLIKK